MYKNIFFSSLIVIFASLLFVINDSIINYLSPRGIKFYHFVFYGTPGFLIVPIFLFFRGNLVEKIRSKNYFIPLFRGLLFAPLPFFGFIALKNIPLPEYTTLILSIPIFSVIISFIFLKEKINLYIILVLIFGISGVIFVIKPSFLYFNYYYLLVLFSAFLLSIVNVIVNKYNNITSSLGFFIYGGIFPHLISIIFFLFDPILLNINDIYLILISSIFVNLAIGLSTYAFQISSKFFASISCLIYTQIFWSVLIGYFYFNEILDKFSIIGAILIIFCGIFSVFAQYKQINSNHKKGINK